MWCYTLLPAILNMSLTAGIVIVVVLFARLPLKKAPKIFSYTLWVVVLFRLLCPVSFSSDFSLLGAFHASTVTNCSIIYIPTDIIHMARPQVDLPLPGVSEFINDTLPLDAEQKVADPLEAPMAIATLLWLGGIAAMLIYSVVSLLLLHRRLIGAVRLRENIYLADHITTPFVIGVIRPKIYLPSTLSAQEQGYIILHEQTHIRRFDHIVKLIAFLALSVHWFNPLVWAAFVFCVKDMEMSCDEAVVAKIGGSIRTEYSASLLSLAAGRKILSGAPLTFGEGDTKSRIKNVLKYKKPAFWAVLVAVIAVIVFCVALMMNPKAEEQTQPLTAAELGRDEHSTIAMMVEGETEKVPATLYIGQGYSIYIPDEGWTKFSEDDTWRADANERVHIQVLGKTMTSLEDARAQIFHDHSSSHFEQYGEDLLIGHSDMLGETVSVKLIAGQKNVYYFIWRTYPDEAAEEFDAQLAAIAGTLEVFTCTLL